MKKWAQIISIVIIGSLGALIFSFLVITKPVADTLVRETVLPVVKVLRAQSSDYQVIINSQGVVDPMQATYLASEVSGKVKFLSPKFEVGQRFKVNELILEIDSSDYEAIQAKSMAELADAKLALSKENALSEQASRDWKVLGEGKKPSDLVLRKPQLESALARVVAAKAGVEKARRDLERTKIRSPYEAKIESTNVELGSLIIPGTVIGSLYSADRYEIRLPVSIGDYNFVDTNNLSKVIYETEISEKIYTWSGNIVRSESKVDQSSQSIFIAASIQNHEANKKFLVPGVYLGAKIYGKIIKGTYTLPRSALYDNDKIIVVGEDKRISIRDIKIVRSTKDNVIVSSGIDEGDVIIRTPLPNVIDGMRVEVYQELPE